MPEDAIPLRSLLLDGARRWGIDHPIETARVFAGWRDLVGEQVAARCQPVSLGRGVLCVAAANPAWAGELRYLAPEVIRRVNKGVGREVVKDLRVTLKTSSGSGSASRSSQYADRRRASGSPASPAPSLLGPGPSSPLVGVGGAGALGGLAEAWGGPAEGRSGVSAADDAEADNLVGAISDERLAAATKRALLAAKTRRKMPGSRS